jgi:hypothetical protein
MLLLGADSQTCLSVDISNASYLIRFGAVRIVHVFNLEQKALLTGGISCWDFMNASRLELWDVLGTVSSNAL